MPEAAGTTATAPKSADRAVPVTLNEAVLDSPTFRAAATHFADQVDAVEKWLNGYVGSTSKLMSGLLSLEDTINNYLSKTTPFPDNVIDNDYTLLALKRTSEGMRELWTQLLNTQKRMETAVVEPIRSFLTGELRNFKEIRRSLEQTQRTYDTTLARYVSQSKTKEPSALREDAFAVYENRKVYIQAAMDYCQLAPQLRYSLDQLLVKVCCDIWKEMSRAKDAASSATRWGRELDRVRGWAKEMELSDNVFRREMQNARKEVSDTTFESFKPSREIEDYSTSTVAFLGSRGPVSVRPNEEGGAAVTEKQGWLFLRIVTGKPVRYNWVRRWYYCRDGVFGWLTPGTQGVLQGDEIGVLLCNVKPAAGEERRFCFELKTKSRSMLMQAETQKELTDWLEVFEISKKKAFEATMDRDNSPLAGGADPAFSISAPSIPEFSAKGIDAQMGSSDDVSSADRTSTLAVPGADDGSSSRRSYDPNGNGSRRSISALGRDLAREEGESGREHAARIIQKLDLHRKATFSASPEPTLTTSNSSGGLSSIISGNQSSQLVGTSLSLTSSSQAKLTGVALPLLDNKPGTLAPPTLARPPTITSFSRTAVLIAGERGHVLEGKKLPTSVIANYWGTNMWGIRQPEPAVTTRLDDDDPIGVVVSEDSQATTPLGEAVQAKKSSESLPPGYPPELRIQHAQFRLLFPNAPPEERLVLVFRAAWSSSLEGSSKSELPAGDGRIYLTAENMYFYGQQMGLVTAYSIPLDIITEVTAAAGRDCDFIFLHLSRELNDTGYKRITIKVFLDDLQLLHARLNLLVDNLQAEEPLDTLETIRALLNIDQHEYDKASPSAESWEEVSSSTPMDNGTALGRPVERSTGDIPRLIAPSSGQKFPLKLNLPKHEVIYEPDDMKEMAAERHFDLSAKACFHVLFGDKSFVFPKLYFEHRAKQIAQGPWSAAAEKEPSKREFQFKIDYVDVFGRSKTEDIRDFQTIDVFNDHVTYVVTHTRTAWHLPHSQLFKLVTKVVITYVAKSKCKLAFYVRIDWSKSPPISKSLVERQALRDAASDAEELAELATDQIHKLGSRSRTHKAIQVYGQVGQQTQVVVFSPAPTDARKKQAIKPRTLTAMLFETVRSLGESVVSSVILWIIAALKKIFDVVTAHRVILLFLGLSIATNLMLSSTESITWWQERRAANFMRRVGVSPNHMMSKAIYIADLHEASGANDDELAPFPQNSTCFGTFREVLDATSMDSPWETAGASLSLPSSRATARRLRKTRQRLGMYRHDLLVAMRVVNSVEREMLQSEWENWLANENSLCDNLEEMLHTDGRKSSGKDNGNDESSQKPMGSIPPERRRALEAWRDDYCGSCRRDHASAMHARRLTNL